MFAMSLCLWKVGQWLYGQDSDIVVVISPVCKTLSQYPGCEKLDYWVKRVTIVL